MGSHATRWARTVEAYETMLIADDGEMSVSSDWQRHATTATDRQAIVQHDRPAEGATSAGPRPPGTRAANGVLAIRAAVTSQTPTTTHRLDDHTKELST
jgi:hypothetical protein